MAKSAVIGNLRVNMGLDSAQFQAGLSRAGKSMDGLAKKVAVFGAAVGAAMTAAVGALSVSVKRTIDEADNMAKSAQKFGVGIEELSRLKHAADLSGVSLETLGKGMQRLSRNMTDAEQGLQAPKRAFDALGISIKNSDGTLKSSTQIMTEVAGRFGAMEDGAAKTSLAMQLFGRAGAEMIPMLNGGADGLREMMHEAENLGIVIDTKTAKAAEAFNDNLTRLGRAKDGLILKVTAALLPTLELLSDKFIDLVKDGDVIRDMAGRLVKALAWIAQEVGQLAILSSRLSAEFAGMSEAFSRLMTGDFSGAWDAFQKGQETSAQMAEDLRKSIASIFSGEGVDGKQDRLGSAGKKAGEKFIANFESATKGKIQVDPMFAEGAQIMQSLMTPLERYRDTIANLNILLDQGAISQDTYNRAVLQAQDAFDKAEAAGKQTESVFQQIGQTMSHSFSSAFTSIIDGSQKVGDAIAGLLKQLANLLMNRAFQMLFNAILPGSGGMGLSYFPPVPGFATGTNFAPGGLAWVGERGPELVNLPRGSQVIPNHELEGMGGGGNVHVTVGVKVDKEGQIRPFVESVSQGVADRRVGQLEATIPHRVRQAIADPRRMS